MSQKLFTKSRFWNNNTDLSKDGKVLGIWVLTFAISIPIIQKFVLWPLARLVMPSEICNKGAPQHIEQAESRPTLKKRGRTAPEGLESYRNSDSVAKLDSINRKLHNKRWKFVVAATKLTSYIFFLAISYWVLRGEQGWFWDPKKYHLVSNTTMPSRIRSLYFMETAYYIYTLVAMFWEPKMKDRAQMVCHHIFTIALLTTSYCWYAYLEMLWLPTFCRNQYRYGTVIMVLHDFSDPWMEAAKLFNYLGVDLGANLCFVVFALSFYYLRVYIFPRYVIKATYDYARPYGSPHYWVTFISLSGLWVLHCIWSVMIYRVFHNSVIAGKVKGDVREEDD